MVHQVLRTVFSRSHSTCVDISRLMKLNSTRSARASSDHQLPLKVQHTHTPTTPPTRTHPHSHPYTHLNHNLPTDQVGCMLYMPLSLWSMHDMTYIAYTHNIPQPIGKNISYPESVLVVINSVYCVHTQSVILWQSPRELLRVPLSSDQFLLVMG